MSFIWRKYLPSQLLIIVLVTLHVYSQVRAQQTVDYNTRDSSRSTSPGFSASPDEDGVQVLGAMHQELRQMSVQLENIKQELRGSKIENKNQATATNKYCKKSVSGVYSVTPRHIGDSAFNVYCDMNTTGGGWLVFQRRINGKVDFYRNWENYRNGFGDLEGEFWLGNDKLYRLTSYGSFRLRIELEDFKLRKVFAEYEHFRISSETDKYRISFDGYYGDAGDSLTYHKGMSFTTFDADNDGGPTINCASAYTGAWWYNHCHNANLNGRYNGSDNLGPRWEEFSGPVPLKFTEMKIKEIDES